MNAEFACAQERVDTTLSAILIHASKGFAYDRSDTAPEADNPMLEVILRSIDDRLRGIDHRFDKMDQRFDKMDQRFDRMEERFERMDERFERMDERFERMDMRFERLEQRVGGLAIDLSALTTSVNGLNTRVSRVESSLDSVSAQVGALGERVARVEEGMKGLSDWRSELKLTNDRTAELITQVSVLAYRIQIMPTWKLIGVAAMGTASVTGAMVSWLTQGGARTIGRWFE